MKLRKVLAMFLSLAMILGTMGTVAIAEENGAATVSSGNAPSAVVSVIDENNLTYAVRFEGKEQIEDFNLWYLDVELKSNKDIYLHSTEPSDGHLSVQVPNVGWRDLPAGGFWGDMFVGGIDLKADEPFKIMDYYWEDINGMAIGGTVPKQKYRDVFGSLNGLACGVKLNQGYPDDLKIEFTYKIYNPNTGSKESIILAKHTFGGTEDEVTNPVAKIGNKYYATVQDAVDAAVLGTNEIELLPGTIDENVFILQQSGRNIIIKGSENVVYTGTFEICGNNRSYSLNNGTGAKETLTFEGINFKGEGYTVAHDFISSTRKNTLPSGELVWAYPHNVTVRNCTFVGNYIGQSADEYAGQEVAAMRNVGGYNWTIENCTGTNLHSLYQASANTLSSKINNITVTNCQSGLNLGTQANYTITNSTISVKEFAIRADMNGTAADLVIDNCELEADETIVLRRDATTEHNLVITNSNVVSNLEPPVHITRSKHTANSNIALDIDLNCWGGVAPSIDTLSDVKPEVLPYYTDEEMNSLGGVSAKLRDEYYNTVTEAVNAASENDVVYVIPGTYADELKITKSITLTGDPNYGSLVLSENNTIEKPVIKISNVTNGGIEYHAPNVTFDNIVFEVAEDATGAGWNVSALGYYYEDVKNREGLTVTNCDFVNNSSLSLGAIAANIGKYTITNNTFKNFASGVWSYVDHGAADDVVVSNNKFENVDTLVNVYYGSPANGNAKVTVTNNKATDGSTTQISVGDFGQTKATPATAYNNVAITGNDAEVVLGNYAKNSFNDTIENNKSVVYSYASEDILKALESAGVPSGDVYVNYGSDSEVMYKVVDGEVYGAAEALEVEFVKADVDTNGNDTDENADLYNINLKANAEGIINRLNSADLTFALTQIKGENAFEIIASNSEVAINAVDNSKVRYEFHYNGKTDATTDTDTVITIGQVKFTGYGTYSFAVDNTATTNTAHSTTMMDNIVDTFVPGADITAGEGELDISDDTIKEITIAVPSRELTINIDFPNEVKKNVADYQDMKVVVSGGDLDKEIEINLGKDAQNVALDYAEKASAKYTVAVADGYEIVLSGVLAVNNAYTVTVSGAGYRTARYTVTMTNDKVLKFWNNVMDEKQVVEIDKASSAVNVTFLAGDIVKDNKINIYDLSAVVSYFGTETNKTAYDAYAKYDLNRDGVIDSKDVAYVLVSWNN